VEYHSRSSGEWILAKVEGYDEVNKVYQLDVQPKAQPDRVRARGAAASDRARSRAAPTSEATLEVESASRESASRLPSGLHSQPVSDPTASTTPVRESRHGSTENSSPQQAERGECGRSAGSAGEARGSDAADGRLILQVEDLQKKVSRLESENEMLQEKLRSAEAKLQSETALKERYYKELCSYHEQRPRVRNTPR